MKNFTPSIICVCFLIPVILGCNSDTIKIAPKKEISVLVDIPHLITLKSSEDIIANDIFKLAVSKKISITEKIKKLKKFRTYNQSIIFELLGYFFHQQGKFEKGDINYFRAVFSSFPLNLGTISYYIQKTKCEHRVFRKYREKVNVDFINDLKLYDENTAVQEKFLS